MTSVNPPEERNNNIDHREAGVDWFRSIVSGVAAVRDVLDFIFSIQLGDVERGAKSRPWAFQGYKGFATPTVRYGLREGRLLWECSGKAAPDTYHRLLQFGGRPTRIDLQATLTFGTPQLRFGKRCFTRSERKARTGLPRLTRVGIARANSGLWLGTAGVRTSNEYYRLYDKGVESRTLPPGRQWRLELEAKGPLAHSLSEEMCALPPDPNWFYKRVVSSWKSQGFAWPSGERTGALPPVERPAKPEPTSIGLGLWLSTSVRPVMHRALKVFSPQELLELLELTDWFVPIRPNDDRS